jgi:hypothetical protein
VKSAADFAVSEPGGVVSGASVASGAVRIVLTLYSRDYCHLCHDMLAELDAIRGALAFEVVVVDVDSDPGLEARFGELVPVLYHQARELARYRLVVSELEAYLAKISGAST